MKVVKRVKPKGSHHKENFFLYIFNFVSIWDDLCQIIIQYTLNYTMLCVSYISVKLEKKPQTTTNINKPTKTGGVLNWAWSPYFVDHWSRGISTFLSLIPFLWPHFGSCSPTHLGITAFPLCLLSCYISILSLSIFPMKTSSISPTYTTQVSFL